MYYKLRDDVSFRQYKDYGYITDNTEYGYRMLNDSRKYPGERYISTSGAAMISELCREPKNIDTIVENLMKFFVGVDFDTLREDTIEFLDRLSKEGFLISGKTYGECNENTNDSEITINETNIGGIDTLKNDNCTRNHISENDFLRSIHIEIANACNERCLHCYIPNADKKSLMKPDLFYKIINEGRQMNIVHVTLSGGEPLMHGNIVDFMQKCSDLDLSVNILSNLTLLTDDMVLEMKKIPRLSVQTSLYAINPVVHDSITGFSGSFKKTKEGILKLLEADIPIQISCPIIRQNKDEFINVVHWGRTNNIGVVVEPEIFASYDHTCSNLGNRLSFREIEEAVEKMLSEGYAETIKNGVAEKESLSDNAPICSICRYHFCVSAEGKVFPCAGWQSNIIGDLNKQTVRDIWEKSEKITELRHIKRKDFPVCVNCENRGYCTVCMMANANENHDGNPFLIRDLHCKVAAMVHEKVSEYVENAN